MKEMVNITKIRIESKKGSHEYLFDESYDLGLIIKICEENIKFME